MLVVMNHVCRRWDELSQSNRCWQRAPKLRPARIRRDRALLCALMFCGISFDSRALSSALCLPLRRTWLVRLRETSYSMACDRVPNIVDIRLTNNEQRPSTALVSLPGRAAVCVFRARSLISKGSALSRIFARASYRIRKDMWTEAVPTA